MSDELNDLAGVPPMDGANPIQLAPSEPLQGLPVGHVLGYMSRDNSPTRVRRVAARCCFWIGIVAVITTLLLANRIGQDAYRSYTTPRWVFPPIWMGRGMPPPMRPTVWEVITEVLTLDGPFVMLMAFIAPSSLLPILAGPIRRGHRLSSYAALVAVCLLLPFLLVVTAGMFCWGLLVGALHRGPYDIPHLMWTLVLPPGIFLTLLLLDLCSYLRWIARNPLTEKTPVKFLPEIAARPT